MPISFTDPNGTSVDHRVEKYIFNVIILMMVHDGFHDFYNDKSKKAFINLFKKLGAVDAAGGGHAQHRGGSGYSASTRMGDRIPRDSTMINFDVIKVPNGILYNQSRNLLQKGELQLHSTLEGIYDELSISLKGDMDVYIPLLNDISLKTFELLKKENLDETINIGKNFIISEFYKLRGYKGVFLISPEDKQKCMEVFRFLDKNSDDNITLGEFTSGIINPETPEIAAFFNIDLPKRPGSEEIDRQKVKDTIVGVFQKIDKDGHEADEGRGISPTELFNYYSEMHHKNEEHIDNTLDKDRGIFKKYIDGGEYKYKDFEEYFYEEKFGNLKNELKEYGCHMPVGEEQARTPSVNEWCMSHDEVKKEGHILLEEQRESDKIKQEKDIMIAESQGKKIHLPTTGVPSYPDRL